MVRYSKEDVLNKYERKRLIDECKTEKETFVIKVLMFTGLRASEFANMRMSWVDWQRDLIYVPRMQGDWKPKTKAGARPIPMTREAKEVLYKFFQEENAVDIHRSTVYRIVTGVGSRIKPFKKVYPHSLRATFASMMAEKGMGAADIQSIMGWDKLETANNYVRSTESINNFREKMQDV